MCIDEIDVCYDYAARAVEALNHMAQGHSPCRDKKTFNALMDGIGDTKYCNFIGTTELSPETLDSHEDWRSFMREGRVDIFIKLTRNSCEIIHHSDLPSYQPTT
jgi:hypothetical protein